MNHTAAVLTISDKGFRGEREDTSGPEICRILEEHGWKVVHTAVLPDDGAQIQAALIDCADERQVPLVLTTGGTGFSPRDVTPEATLAVVERETPGIPEAMRAESMRITPRGCLSRSAAGIRKPSAEIFRIAERELGLGPEELAYVGDTLSRDVKGVRNAGWRLMIQIKNPGAAHRDKGLEHSGLKPDYLVEGLEEIPEIIRKVNEKL